MKTFPFGLATLLLAAQPALAQQTVTLPPAGLEATAAPACTNCLSTQAVTGTSTGTVRIDVPGGGATVPMSPQPPANALVTTVRCTGVTAGGGVVPSIVELRYGNDLFPVQIWTAASGCLAGLTGWNGRSAIVTWWAIPTATVYSAGFVTVSIAMDWSAPVTTSVSISPAIASVTFGGPLQQFTATVSNASDTGVTWSVVEGPSGGLINSSGYYTPVAPGTFHVRATLVADPSKSATATVTVYCQSGFTNCNGVCRNVLGSDLANCGGRSLST